jgi:predicted dehydrogenase
MIRLGIVGLGEVSAAHLSGYAEVEGVRVVAACDIDPCALASAPAGVERFDDWRALVDSPRVDAVAVLLPHDLHHPVAAAVLDAGKHVCIEKPMALTAAQCADLIQRAGRTRSTLAVAENVRYVPAYQQAALELESLGQIRLARTFIYGSAVGNYRRTDAGWRIRAGGIGAVIDAAPHSFYLLRWLLGPVASLQASTRHWVRDNLVPDSEVEDGAVASGTLAGGGHFTCEVSLSAELPWGERLELYGERGSLVADSISPTPLRIYDGVADLSGSVAAAISSEGWQHSIRAAARDFAESIRDRRAPSVAAADAAYAVELAECTYRSDQARGVPVHPRNDV